MANEKKDPVRRQVVEKLAALITAGFGLVAALAWNDTIKAIFAKVFQQSDNLTAMITYAVVVTVIAVVITIWIGKIAGEKEK